MGRQNATSNVSGMPNVTFEAALEPFLRQILNEMKRETKVVDLMYKYCRTTVCNVGQTLGRCILLSVLGEGCWDLLQVFNS